MARMQVFRWFRSLLVPVMELFRLQSLSEKWSSRSAFAEAKPHSEACRERVRQAADESDDVGQQRLHAEQRIAPTGGQHLTRRARKRRLQQAVAEQRPTPIGRDEQHRQQSEDQRRWVLQITQGSSRRRASARWQ